MSGETSRTIHQRAGSGQIPHLLQALFVTELLRPSGCLWLVSPWISDIAVVDNRAGNFDILGPEWGHGKVRLSQIILRLAATGSTIHIATRPATHNEPFIATLQSAMLGHGSSLKVHVASELHEKGLLGDRFYLRGSMNFTHNGVSVNDEQVTFDTSASAVAEARLHFRDWWGAEA